MATAAETKPETKAADPKKSVKKCTHCKGTGKTLHKLEGRQPSEVACPVCGGSGEHEDAAKHDGAHVAYGYAADAIK